MSWAWGGLALLLSITTIICSPDLWASEKSACSHRIDGCDYYLCLEETLSCGDFGYPLAFGFPYCSQFLGHTRFLVSEQTRAWLPLIGQCLREETDRIFLDRQAPTCGRLKRHAIAVHSDCYLTTGYCDLPLEDQLTIISTIRRELWAPEILLEAIQIQFGCGKVRPGVLDP